MPKEKWVSMDDDLTTINQDCYNSLVELFGAETANNIINEDESNVNLPKEIQDLLDSDDSTML